MAALHVDLEVEDLSGVANGQRVLVLRGRARTKEEASVGSYVVTHHVVDL